MKWWIIMLIIVAVAMIIMGVLYFIGKRLQKKQQVQKDAIREQAQKVTMLVIDKNAANEGRGTT